MLSLSPTTRIWVCTTPADMRKSFDGLCGLIRQGLGGDPLSGEVFVFRNKAADRVKILMFEGDGLVGKRPATATLSAAMAGVSAVRALLGPSEGGPFFVARRPAELCRFLGVI